jgi:hypothetical protein
MAEDDDANAEADDNVLAKKPRVKKQAKEELKAEVDDEVAEEDGDEDDGGNVIEVD